MNTVEGSAARIASLRVTMDEIIAQLTDGRTISVPLAWSWRLSEATPQQRNNFEILGNGQGAHWKELDEDISVWGMLHGIPARHPQTQLKQSMRPARLTNKRAKATA